MTPIVGLWYACTVHSPQDEGGEWIEALLRTRDGWKSVSGMVVGGDVTPLRWTPHPRVTYVDMASMMREALEIGDALAKGRKGSVEKWREFSDRTRGRMVL